MSGIGAMVAELRGRLGWTQEELARRVGVSAQAVSKWETDQSMPDVGLLVPLAQALGCTVDDLLTGDLSALQRPPGKPGPAVTGESVPEGQRATRVVIRVEHDDEEHPVLVTIPIGVLRFGMRLLTMFPVLAGTPEIDPAELLEHVRRGLVGEVIRVEAQDGALVTVTLE